MITLHYYPGNASFTPHVLLHEIGAPFELKLVRRTRRRAQAARLPEAQPERPDPCAGGWRAGAVRDRRDLPAPGRHAPRRRAGAAAGHAERAHFYKWLVWLTNTLQAMLMHYFYPERMVDDGDAAAARAGQGPRAGPRRRDAGAAGRAVGVARRRRGCWARTTARSTPSPSCCAAGHAASTTGRRAASRTSRPSCSACWRGRRCSARWRPRA